LKLSPLISGNRWLYRLAPVAIIAVSLVVSAMFAAAGIRPL
jgi:hypothetical protein